MRGERGNRVERFRAPKDLSRPGLTHHALTVPRMLHERRDLAVGEKERQRPVADQVEASQEADMITSPVVGKGEERVVLGVGHETLEALDSSGRVDPCHLVRPWSRMSVRL